MRTQQNMMKDLNEQNYIRTNNVIIMLNPTSDVIRYMNDNVIIRSSYKVHIFVTDFRIFNEEFVKEFDQLTDFAKYYIHIPKKLKDIKPIAEKYISELLEHKEIKILLEKVGPIFRTSSMIYGYYPICVTYHDEYLEIYLQLKSSGFNSTYFGIGSVAEGAFRNGPQMAYPEIFKQNIINNFKSVTPLGILKTFKNEEDIWDYINHKGEWVISENKKDINAGKVNLNIPAGKTAQDVKESLMNSLKENGFNVKEVK